MIDIHSHILPNIDDGPADTETSIALAKAALQHGVTTVIATPHCWPEVYLTTPDIVLTTVQQLQIDLKQQDLPLQVLPGMEVHLTLDAAQSLARGEILTLGNLGQYLLVELPSRSVPNYTEQVLFEIMLQGVTPIIAHPERNKEIAAAPTILYNLLTKGCLVQVTAGSITGRFGSKVQHLTQQFIKLGWVDFVASDAHHPTLRSINLQQAYQQLTQLVNEQRAESLMLHNPQCILNGEQIVKDYIEPYHSVKKSIWRKNIWLILRSLFKKQHKILK